MLSGLLGVQQARGTREAGELIFANRESGGQREAGRWTPRDPGVFPDYPAPVVRNADTGRELTTMRWGMPPPPRAGGFPVTNIRNTSSPHWLAWLKPEEPVLGPVQQLCGIRTQLWNRSTRR